MIINDVHRFVVRHPAFQRVFPGWRSDQLMWHLAETLRDGELYVAADEDRIYGVIIAEIDHTTQQICVSSIITSTDQTFKTFVIKWAGMYPDYTVVGRRNGKLRHYKLRNFRRLLNHERAHSTVSC